MKRLVAHCRGCGRTIVWLRYADRPGAPRRSTRRRVCLDATAEALRLAAVDGEFDVGDRRLTIHHNTCSAAATFVRREPARTSAP